MSMLNKKPPHSYIIGGKEYIINTDFRVWIEVENILQSNITDECAKIVEILTLIFPVIPKDLEKAVECISLFFCCGKTETNKKVTSKQRNNIYSYDFDDCYIYSAFLDQYGIDLNTIDYLHWWKFKSMFQGLKADNRIVEIMGYRATDVTSKMSKDQAEFYRKMKKTYAIPIDKTEQELMDSLENALQNGGDISAFIKEGRL